MGLGPIIDSIWALPWWKVMMIAAIDDIMLLLKIWPVYLIIFLASLAIWFFTK